MCQGTGQGIEDAAVLAELLSHTTATSEIPRLTTLYYQLRHPRAEKVRELGRMNGQAFQMVNGPEQEKRDRYLCMPLRERRRIDPGYLDLFGEVEFHAWLDGLDVTAKARDAHQRMAKQAAPRL